MVAPPMMEPPVPAVPPMMPPAIGPVEQAVQQMPYSYKGVTAQDIMQYLGEVSQLTPEQMAVADVNQDNAIDILDASWILQMGEGLRDPNTLEGIEQPAPELPMPPAPPPMMPPAPPPMMPPAPPTVPSPPTFGDEPMFPGQEPKFPGVPPVQIPEPVGPPMMPPPPMEPPMMPTAPPTMPPPPGEPPMMPPPPSLQIGRAHV